MEEQMEGDEEHEQYQVEDENAEQENEDIHEEYEIQDNHNNVEQEEIQENKPQEDLKIKKNEKISKNSNKTSSKKSSKKPNTKDDKTIKSTAPNKTQMKQYQDSVLKAMNYRVDIYKTQENCKKLEKVMQQKTDTDNNDNTKISSANKNKNTLATINKSLTNQSENPISEQSEEKTIENANENKLTISMSGTPPVITMDDGQGNINIIKSKAGLMKFLYKIYTENLNLKNFQGQVFNLSKNYDDINNILAESISGFQDIAKSTKREDIISEVDTKLKELKTQVESSMEQRQNEYNTNLEKKEEDINMITKAYNNVYKEIQQKKSDKLHELKTIEDLNSQISILETKLAYLKQKH